MKFMKDFSDEFPYDKYPMNSKDNKGDDELLKDVNQRLKIQKEIILNIVLWFHFVSNQMENIYF